MAGMRPILVSALCLLFAQGCSDKKKAPAEEQAASCEATSDCEAGQICLDGACASTAPGAIYTDTDNAVTPDKVKSEVDRINEQTEERNSEILDGL